MDNPVLAVLVLISLPAVVSIITLAILSAEARKSWMMRDELDRLKDIVNKMSTRQTITHQYEDEE